MCVCVKRGSSVCGYCRRVHTQPILNGNEMNMLRSVVKHRLTRWVRVQPSSQKCSISPWSTLKIERERERERKRQRERERERRGRGERHERGRIERREGGERGGRRET